MLWMKKFVEYRNFGECLAYIEGLMIKDGPFDGLMGFSQGGILSAALPGLQSRVGQYRYPVKDVLINYAVKTLQ